MDTPRGRAPDLRRLAGCVPGGRAHAPYNPDSHERERPGTAVSAGMGITFVFSSFTSYVREKVVLRPVEDLELTMALELAWLRGNSSATLQHFIQTIEAEKKKRPSAAAVS